jgi:DNA helicase II / ATP-dependent DNA helicase PcrA
MNPAAADYLEALNPRQREAVEHQGSPLLILAGAGSGKTRVITTKIAWLIAQGLYSPYEILAVTFTNKAAREMHERVARMAPNAAGVLIRTFHSFGAWLLRRNAERAGLDKNFTIYDDDDSITLLKSLYNDRTRRELAKYAHAISRAKDYCLKSGDDLSDVSLDPDFPEMYKRYQKRLDEMGNTDFGDLIMKTVMLLRNDPEVQRSVQERFRIVLVDEYQDSNVAQFQLLSAVTGDETYLCVVGDDDQSIYRFRGAEVRNILTFQEHFPGTKIVKLEQNYRSTQSILELASQVVSANRGRLGKKLWTARKGGKKPMLVFLQDQDQEARFCADLLEDGNLEGTAILYRTNAQSLAFESLFTNLGVPYRIVGALRFYEREEVRDSLALLSLLLNPRDEVAFRRIINKPTRGIGPAAMEKILEAANGTAGDLIRAAENASAHLTKKAATGAQEFVRIFQGAGTGANTGANTGDDAFLLPELIQEMMKSSRLLEYHREQDQISGSSKLRNMEELVSASADFEPGMEGLVSFLELIELDRSRFAEQSEDGRERVTLITMHNTKGLEFPRVIITGLDEGLFPNWQSENDEDLEEERRIFYVSVTRAMDELYLVTCRTRRLWGQTRNYSQSRFLLEVPSELFDTPDGIGAQAGRDGQENQYPVGMRIYHDDYGSGTIVKSWYNGADLVVQVRFETGRSARFLPKYTSLEKISYDD